MCLVDRQERDARTRGGETPRQRSQSLRRAVQQCESPCGGGIEDDSPLVCIELAVHVRRRDTPPPQRADLVLHQRDQGRDNEGESVAEERRYLITRRLA